MHVYTVQCTVHIDMWNVGRNEGQHAILNIIYNINGGENCFAVQ